MNIPNLVYTLHEYRSLFSQKTGLAFDLQQAINEIEDENSEFWKAFFNDHYLLGIVCGYGEKNAFLYDWSEKSFLGILRERRLFFSRDSKVVPGVKTKNCKS